MINIPWRTQKWYISELSNFVSIFALLNKHNTILSYSTRRWIFFGCPTGLSERVLWNRYVCKLCSVVFPRFYYNCLQGSITGYWYWAKKTLDLLKVFQCHLMKPRFQHGTCSCLHVGVSSFCTSFFFLESTWWMIFNDFLRFQLFFCVNEYCISCTKRF